MVQWRFAEKNKGVISITFSIKQLRLLSKYKAVIAELISLLEVSNTDIFRIPVELPVETEN